MADKIMHHVVIGSKTYEIVDEQGRAKAATNTQDITALKEDISELSGLSDDVKTALLQIAQKVAYVDAQGQTYYDALYGALYPPADLVSISAVYTQSGTVYNTDSLDSLKTDLVVTAHYSDSSTQTVTTYTLSGTLSVGTSTVTVAYGGKTTTFDVTVTDPNALPSGYTKYDYIANLDAAGDNANVIINTGINSIYCDTEYIHEIVMNINPVSGTNNGLYGCRNATGSAGAKNGNTLWANNKDKIAVGYNGVDSGYTLNFTWGEKHSIKLDTGKVYIDDVQVSTPTGTRTSYNTSAIRLFGVATNESSYSGIHGTMKLYSVKIKDSRTNEMIANLVPCTNPSNIPGVYDTIRQSFHYAVNYSIYTCGNDEV